MWTIKYDAKTITRDDIPKNIGVYAWFDKSDDSLIYIGKAAGRDGLKERISQHLNMNYLEAREEKHTSKDIFQINNPIYNNKNRLAIDKSAFRKNVARMYSLKAGFESVEYLKDNFLVSWITFENNDKQKVVELESELIKTLKPKFNIAGIIPN